MKARESAIHVAECQDEWSARRDGTGRDESRRDGTGRDKRRAKTRLCAKDKACMHAHAHVE